MLFMVHIIDYKSHDVIVVYLFFAVRQFFEFSEEIVDFLFCERLETKFCQMISKGMTGQSVYPIRWSVFSAPTDSGVMISYVSGLLIIPCW